MRVVNRIVAAVVALALAVGGFLLAAEIIAALLDRAPLVVTSWPEWYDRLDTAQWDSDDTRWVAGGLLAAGLLLLLLQLVRRRLAVLPVAGGGGGVDGEVSRSSFESSLARAVEQVDGVSKASARVNKRRIGVRAHTNRRQPGDLDRRVADAADAHLRRVAVVGAPPLRVDLRSSR